MWCDHPFIQRHKAIIRAGGEVGQNLKKGGGEG